jgi:hypothetical protein
VVARLLCPSFARAVSVPFEAEFPRCCRFRLCVVRLACFLALTLQAFIQNPAALFASLPAAVGESLLGFFSHVASLGFESKPDYRLLGELLSSGLDAAVDAAPWSGDAIVVCTSASDTGPAGVGEGAAGGKTPPVKHMAMLATPTLGAAPVGPEESCGDEVCGPFKLPFTVFPLRCRSRPLWPVLVPTDSPASLLLFVYLQRPDSAPPPFPYLSHCMQPMDMSPVQSLLPREDFSLPAGDLLVPSLTATSPSVGSGTLGLLPASSPMDPSLPAGVLPSVVGDAGAAAGKAPSFYDFRAIASSCDALLESRGGSWEADTDAAVKANCIGLDSLSVVLTRPDTIDVVVRSLLNRPSELRQEIRTLEVTCNRFVGRGVQHGVGPSLAIIVALELAGASTAAGLHIAYCWTPLRACYP